MPREFRFFGIFDVVPVQLPIRGEGRPPLKASVVPTRRVLGPSAFAAESSNTMLPVPPILENSAIGKSLGLDSPTVYVPPHFDMRESEGCLFQKYQYPAHFNS